MKVHNLITKLEERSGYFKITLVLAISTVALLLSIFVVQNIAMRNLNFLSEASVNANLTIVPAKVSVNEINTNFDNLYTDNVNAWLGNAQSTNSYLGLTFVGSPISSQSTIDSVKLELTSSQTQWIDTSADFSFEDNATPSVLSSTSLPSSRTKFSTPKHFIDNNKWVKDSKYYVDLTNSYRALLQKYGSLTTVNVIAKGTGGNYARKFFYGSKNSVNSPKLIVTLRANSTPVPTTIVPTSTVVPTTTPVVTTTMVMPSATPTPPVTTVGTNSAAMGLWNPNTDYDKCFNIKDGTVNATATANIKAFHDSFKVLGPDGKWYPTWHPPVAIDPATGAECHFGHDHGRDPSKSMLWLQAKQYFYYDANQNGKMDPSEEAVSGLPFGYVNEQADSYYSAMGQMTMRHEDHVGHKVDYANDETDIATDVMSNTKNTGVWVGKIAAGIIAKDTGVRCYYLVKPHQGVSTGDAFMNNIHEVFYFASCTAPNSKDNQKISIAMMEGFGAPGGFTSFMPLCGIERRADPQDLVCPLGKQANGQCVLNAVNQNYPSGNGNREIITRQCIEKGFLVPQGSYSGNLYEAWPASLAVQTKDGRDILNGINLLFDVEDANRYYFPQADKASRGYNNPDAGTNVGFTMDLCYDTSLFAQGLKARGGLCDYATNYGQIQGIKWNDPRSAFKGLHRGLYFMPGILNNAGGPETWYTDPYGQNASTTTFAGSIKQSISSKNVNYSTLINDSIDPRVNDRVHDDGKGSVHAPN